ncbi:MAG: hypothetical protein ACI90V_000962 [Bacillariaceae sp.]|jgi:hypothetical protein
MNEIENGKNGGWHGIWNKEVNDVCKQQGLLGLSLSSTRFHLDFL